VFQFSFNIGTNRTIQYDSRKILKIICKFSYFSFKLSTFVLIIYVGIELCGKFFYILRIIFFQLIKGSKISFWMSMAVYSIIKVTVSHTVFSWIHCIKSKCNNMVAVDKSFSILFYYRIICTFRREIKQNFLFFSNARNAVLFLLNIYLLMLIFDSYFSTHCADNMIIK